MLRLHSAAIRYFEAVRRAGSIRAAARELNVVSSAVNRQILKLEDELGAQLFERQSSGLKLTEAGELLARHVTTTLQDASRFEDELALFKGGMRGDISVVTAEGLNHDFLPRIIEQMVATRPFVKIRVRTVPTRLIPQAIADGETDVGIGFAVSASPDIEQLAYGQFAIGVLLPPDHALAQQHPIALLDTLSFPWILGNENLAIRPLLEPTLRATGKTIPALIETGSLELMKQLTLRGVGLSFQSQFGFEDALRLGQLRHIPVHHNGPILRDLSIHVRKGRRLSAATQAFINLAIEELESRQRQENHRAD